MDPATGNHNGEPAKAEQPKIEVTIVFNPSTGEISLTAPIQNPPLVYYILRKGERVMEKLEEESIKKQSGIIPVRSGLPIRGAPSITDYQRNRR